MASSRADILVYGASGFTGQYVLRDVMNLAKFDAGLTWLAGGRNKEKVKAVIQRMAQETGLDIGNIDEKIVVADVQNEEALKTMASSARVVISCVGPYRFYGEPVVKACVEAGTNYVDISGEPAFLESMEVKYDEEARSKKIVIVGACGFDSIPCDLGVEYTKKQYSGDLNSIESFLRFKSGPEGAVIHFTTYESAVYGFAHSGDLKLIRKQSNKERVPKATHRLRGRSVLHYNNDIEAWCLPFPGSDRSVVNRSQRYNYFNRSQRATQLGAFMEMPSLLASLVVAFFAVVFGIFANFSFGRKMLLRYPGFFTGGFFSRDGPTEAQMKSTSFQITFVGQGYDDGPLPIDHEHPAPPTRKIVTRVSGPEPGYIATPICVVQSAYTILRDRDAIPKEGGVLTPGAAFTNTGLIERLQKCGMKFEVLKKAD